MQEEGKEDGGHITTKKEGRWLNSFPSIIVNAWHFYRMRYVAVCTIFCPLKLPKLNSRMYATAFPCWFDALWSYHDTRRARVKKMGFEVFPLSLTSYQGYIGQKQINDALRYIHVIQ